jgi:hypothetical protein
MLQAARVRGRPSQGADVGGERSFFTAQISYRCNRAQQQHLGCASQVYSRVKPLPENQPTCMVVESSTAIKTEW